MTKKTADKTFYFRAECEILIAIVEHAANIDAMIGQGKSREFLGTEVLCSKISAIFNQLYINLNGTEHDETNKA